MSDKINWKEYANKVGIKSPNAYKKLFGVHTHPLAESGDETAYVPMDDAIDAIKISELDNETYFENFIQKWKKEYIELLTDQKMYIRNGEYISARIALNKLTIIKNMLKDLGYEIDF